MLFRNAVVGLLVALVLTPLLPNKLAHVLHAVPFVGKILGRPAPLVLHEEYDYSASCVCVRVGGGCIDICFAILQ